MKHCIASFTAAALGLFSAVSHGENLLTNGNFEIGEGGTASLRAGSNNITGWTITGDKSLYWVQPGPFPFIPPDGTNYVDLNGSGGSITLSQSFPTTPGKLYEVAFSVGFAQATNGGSPYFLTAKLTASDEETIGSATAYAPNALGWAGPTRFQFVATTISSTIHFTDSSATVNYDLTLDNTSVVPLAQTNVFAEYLAFDANAETASGVLNGVPFTLQCTRAAPRPGSGDNGGVVGGITNGTSVLFSNATVFTPALNLGDELILGAASDFRITFAQPVSHLTMHLFQLQANRLAFTSGNKPETFSLLSSDGDLIIYSSNTSLQGGSGGGDDASGSLLFPGTFTELSWTSAFGTNTTGSTAEDGIRLQLSVTAEARAVLSIHSLGTQQAQLMWETNFAAYVLESTTVLPATNWVAVTNSVSLSGEHFTVAVNAQEPARFFRLRRN